MTALRHQLAEIREAEWQFRFAVPRMDRREGDAKPEEVAAMVEAYRTPAPANLWGMTTMLGLRVTERLAGHAMIGEPVDAASRSGGERSAS